MLGTISTTNYYESDQLIINYPLFNWFNGLPDVLLKYYFFFGGISLGAFNVWPIIYRLELGYWFAIYIQINNSRPSYANKNRLYSENELEGKVKVYGYVSEW